MYDNSLVAEERIFVKPALRVADCRLIKVEVVDDPKYGAVGQFTFQEMKTKGVFTHKEFVPTPKKDSVGEAAETSLKNKQTMLAKWLKHFIGAYTDTSKIDTIKAVDFGDYLRQNIALFPSNYNTIPCDLKVVSNNKGFPILPKSIPFISTALKPRNFTTDTAWDKYVGESATPDVEKAEDSPFATPADTAEKAF